MEAFSKDGTNLEFPLFEMQLRVRLLKIDAWRDLPLFQGQRHFDDGRNTAGRFGVANVRLY